MGRKDDGSTTAQEALRALAGMVIQSVPGCDGVDLSEYGIERPHRQHVSIHLSFHAAALRLLGRVGAMDIEDRGGRLVLANFRPEWLIANGFVPYAWECRCDDREGSGVVEMVEVDRDGKPVRRG